MSKIKTYQAETLRKALEEIKQELGEDAIVLSHKRVNVGGFLGFGSREVVEVQAVLGLKPIQKSIPPESKKEEVVEPSKIVSKTNSLDSLNETKEKIKALTSPSLASFAARAYSGLKTSIEDTTDSKSMSSLGLSEILSPVSSEKQKTEKEFTQKVLRPVVLSANPPPSPLQFTSTTKELSQLRSEIREIKFSLSSLGKAGMRKNISTESSPDFNSYPEIFDSPYYEAYLTLAGTGLDPILARQAMQFAAKTSPAITEEDLNSVNKVARIGLSKILQSTMRFVDDNLTIHPDTSGPPSSFVFIGPTGVGKTTTIAKLAALATLRAHRQVELITLDTYRIAAVEQLKTYAEIIGVGCHVAKSLSELNILLDNFADKATVFIDTVGRNPNDLADQIDLADYLHRMNDIRKCLVLQATTHPDDAESIIRKFSLYGIDQLILTKLDETIFPGRIINTIINSGLPLTYICTGQRVPEDIEQANASSFAARVLHAAMIAIAA